MASVIPISPNLLALYPLPPAKGFRPASDPMFDDPPLRRFEVWYGRLRTAEHTSEVGVDLGLPVLDGKLLDGRENPHPGIVHQNVQPA